MQIGFIGFGEAGSSIARGLRSAGVSGIHAFDINADAPDLGPAIQQRAADTQTTLVKSSRELVRASEIVFSTVTSSSALAAASAAAPFLGANHFYADLNSVSPALKREVAAIIGEGGARFVEVAVMAPVLPYGHRVPMLLGGPFASAFAEEIRPLGMRGDVLTG